MRKEVRRMLGRWRGRCAGVKREGKYENQKWVRLCTRSACIESQCISNVVCEVSVETEEVSKNDEKKWNDGDTRRDR